MSTRTETAAQAIVNSIHLDTLAPLTVTFEPEPDLRSGGTFFEVEDPRGHCFTVVVTEES